MDNRFPYDSTRDQQRLPPQLSNMTPLELEEALFMQRRQEFQRDLQLRQMIQDQFDQQHLQQQQRMLELHHHLAGQQAMASLRHDEQIIQNQMRRHHLHQQLQQQQQHLGLPAGLPSIGSPIQRPAVAMNADTFVGDSLSANTQRRNSAGNNRKRSFDQSEESETPPGLKRQAGRKETATKSASKRRKDSFDRGESPKSTGKKEMKKRAATEKTSPSTEKMKSDFLDENAREAAEDLLSVAMHTETIVETEAEDEVIIIKATIENLVDAAESEEKVDVAAKIMLSFQEIEWPATESEPSEDEDDESRIKIILNGFKSKLPCLPVEPEIDIESNDKDFNDSDKNEDEDLADMDGTPTEATQNGSRPKDGAPIAPTEYPYPVDTWWPSIATIRKERRMNGERTDEEDFTEDPESALVDAPFRANLPVIQSRLANEVDPGVLEKIPHCRIHRLKTRKLKGATIPDHAFCWQLTENYCTDVMVCCSVCSTWRHAGCGGHHKPYSVRENIESGSPFVPVCDLCHEEQAILQEFPKGKARLERQRIEQLRRGLATSTVIRQSSFVKHGGTYKWPLGSVSATHIGGHTRSVQSRHDKSEKMWTEMTNRLSRGMGYRPKERIKVRTRELERLLACVDDAESITDRHNMMQFLQHDSCKKHPPGFEQHLRNLFDPDDDTHDQNGGDSESASSTELTELDGEEEPDDRTGFVGRRPPTHLVDKSDEDSQAEESTCARDGCCQKHRFDSIFCSDSCGVCALEFDLFRVLEVAGEIHPSLMRS